MKKFLQAMAARRKNNKTSNASLADYKDESTLKAVLSKGDKKKKKSSRSSVRSSLNSNSSVHSTTSSLPPDFASSNGDDPSVSSVEWQLPLVDEAVTEPQTMEQELKRLQALQSYFVLDSQGEAQFDRITRLASQIFDTPIALVSLVDLGRQWFLSRVGLDATETARKHAFCAHVILNKYKILVVPDATKDFRFQNNPLVTSGVKIRFYAGAALVSPEGYKLGTLCVISPHKRPAGLTDAEQGMLHNMADMVVQTMVSRRDRMIKQEYEQERIPALTSTLVETSQKLRDSRTLIENVLKRDVWNMDPEDMTQLTTALGDMTTQAQICDATVRTSRNDVDPTTKENVSNDMEDETTASASTMDSSLGGEDVVQLDTLLSSFDAISNPTTDMSVLFNNVNTIVSKFPYRDQVTVELHHSVPRRIVTEDLLLFRSVLNLLTHCMGQQPGDEEDASFNTSGLFIRQSPNAEHELLVKAVQRGKPISMERARELFRDKDSLLAPVATMVRSMGGRHGMYQGKWTHGPNANERESNLSAQSILWFQIPFGLSEQDAMEPQGNQFEKSLAMTHDVSSPLVDSPSLSASKKTLESDPFQDALLSVGCGGR